MASKKEGLAGALERSRESSSKAELSRPAREVGVEGRSKISSPSGRRTDADPMPLERIVEIAEFRRSLRAFLRRSETVARTWALTPQRYLLLLAVKGAPDRTERVSLTELSDRLQLSRNTVTELCARAEAAGLVTRESADGDRRLVYIRLTAEGERRLRGALLESDAYRHELAASFAALAESFDAASNRA